jgi:hypothetical protein
VVVGTRHRVRSAAVTVALVGALGAVGMPSPALAVTAGSITQIALPGLPASTDAVLLNLAMVGGASPGYVTADRCSPPMPVPPTHANGYHPSTGVYANLAVAPVDPDGRTCLYSNAPVELIADLQGAFTSNGTGDRYVPGDGRRVLDTRTTSVTPVPAGSITPVSTGVSADVDAVLVDLAMVDGVADGYVTADRCSTLAAGPQAFASATHAPVDAVANLAVVPVDTDGRFCLYNHAAVDLVVDLQGTFVHTTDGLGFAPTSVGRLLDTRAGGAAPVPGGSVTVVRTGVPAGTKAVLVDLAMVDGAAPGFVTADRCDALTAGPPGHANGNHLAARTAANLSVVPVADDGTFCIYNLVGVHLVVDLEGRFAPDGPDGFVALAPTRVLDTRPATPPPPTPGTTSCRSVVHIGDSTSVGMISSKLLPDASDRLPAQYVRVGVADPRMEISGARSTLETLPGQENAYQVAQRQRAAGFHGCWVLALGTTDSANIAAGASPGADWRIDRMMSVIGSDPVMWVNVKTIETTGPWANSSMLVWDAALVRATARYPNIKIYDWASVAQRSWFSADRVHYTSEGFRIRAHSIADALSVLYPG